MAEGYVIESHIGGFLPSKNSPEDMREDSDVFPWLLAHIEVLSHVHKPQALSRINQPLTWFLSEICLPHAMMIGTLQREGFALQIQLVHRVLHASRKIEDRWRSKLYVNLGAKHI